MDILMIGCGNMGGALAGAWADEHRVLALEPRAALPAGVERIAALNPMVLPDPLLVVMAVKPQLFGEVAPLIAPLAGPERVFVSIMAGVPVASLLGALGHGAAMLRVMPNTPAAVGAGVTGAFAPPGTEEAARTAVSTLFGAVGDVVWLSDEAQFDAVTAVSGSGSAYFFRFAEAMARAGEAAGLPADVAMRLARGTLSGAGALAARDPAALAELRQRVTSPGGTTAAGLAAMEAGVEPLAVAAVDAAARRSAELAASAR